MRTLADVLAGPYRREPDHVVCWLLAVGALLVGVLL